MLAIVVLTLAAAPPTLQLLARAKLHVDQKAGAAFDAYLPAQTRKDKLIDIIFTLFHIGVSNEAVEFSST